VQRRGVALPAQEVGAAVHERGADAAGHGGDGEPPQNVAAEPRGGGVPEVVGRHVGGERDDGVVAGLGPLAEERVARVLGERDVLDLPAVGVDAGVEDHGLAVREDGDRP